MHCDSMNDSEIVFWYHQVYILTTLNSTVSLFGWICVYAVVFFFFQAEDGIRDLTVTGVQTCALPISASAAPRPTITRWTRCSACAPTGSRASCTSRRASGSRGRWTAGPAGRGRRPKPERGGVGEGGGVRGGPII